MLAPRVMWKQRRSILCFLTFVKPRQCHLVRLPNMCTHPGWWSKRLKKQQTYSLVYFTQFKSFGQKWWSKHLTEWRSSILTVTKACQVYFTHCLIERRDNDHRSICVISPQRMTLDSESWSRITMKRWTTFISQLYQKSYSRYRSASAISRLSLSRICNPRSLLNFRTKIRC
jgi:hypothetical protein